MPTSSYRKRAWDLVRRGSVVITVVAATLGVQTGAFASTTSAGSAGWMISARTKR